MDYDMTRLEKLGAEVERLDKRLKDARAELRAEILAADGAGVKQVAIVKASRYTRDAIYKMLVKVAQQELEADPELVEQMERTASEPDSRVKRGRPTRKDGA